MSEPENTADQLAKQFLDLWQKQLASMLREPEMAGEMLHTMQMMQRNFMQQLTLCSSYAKNTSSADTSLPEYGDDELLELDRRLRVCEERIYTLESLLREHGIFPDTAD